MWAIYYIQLSSVGGKAVFCIRLSSVDEKAVHCSRFSSFKSASASHVWKIDGRQLMGFGGCELAQKTPFAFSIALSGFRELTWVKLP